MQQKIDIIITAKDQASNVLQGLGGIARGVLKLGVAAAAVGFTALTTGVAFAVKEAMEAQEVFAQTEAVIKSTGGVAGITAQEAAGLAESLSEVTRFSDETVLAGENILLTFTNIGEDVFPDATGVMLDMSQALGQDLQSSAIQLGKALQDPVQGITALRRVGVNFTDEQQKMIEGLVEAGKLEEAQTMILKELQTEFGGSAEAAGQTFAGQLDILRNKVSNVAEGIGTSLLPVGMMLVDKFLVPALPVIQAFAEQLAVWIELFVGAETPLEGVRLLLADMFNPSVLAGFDFLVAKFNEIKTAILEFVNTTLIPFVTLHAEEFKGALIAIGIVLAGAALIGGILAIGTAIAALANPITLVIAGAALLGAAWAGNWGGIRTTLTDFWNTTGKPIFDEIVGWLQTNIPAAITTVSGFWTNTLQPALSAIWTFLSVDMLPIWTALGDLLSAVVGKAVEALAGIWQNVLQPAIEAIWDFIKTKLLPIFEDLKPAIDAVVGVIKTLAEWIGTLADKIANLELPEWMQTNSPMPWEIGLRGVSAAMEDLAGKSLPQLSLGIRALPTSPIGVNGAAGVAYGTAKAGGMGGGGFYVGEINIFPPEGADAAQVAELVLVKLSQAMSGGASMMYAE